MTGSNDNERLIDELANLLNEAAEAHHKAFAATEGVALTGLFGMQITYLRKCGKY
jgi:hypothetical protein